MSDKSQYDTHTHTHAHMQPSLQTYVDTSFFMLRLPLSIPLTLGAHTVAATARIDFHPNINHSPGARHGHTPAVRRYDGMYTGRRLVGGLWYTEEGLMWVGGPGCIKRNRPVYQLTYCLR